MNKQIINNKTIYKSKKKDRSVLGPPPSEMQIRHCMLYEFNKGCNATQATKNICDVYGIDSLKVNKCQRWFRRFSTGDFDITNNHRSGRPTELDNVHLKTMVEENPRQTIQEIAEKLNASRSTVHEHLKQIGKYSQDGVWVNTTMLIGESENAENGDHDDDPNNNIADKNIDDNKDPLT